MTYRAPICKLAFHLASWKYPDHNWHFYTIETSEERAAFEAEEHRPDIIISYLNSYIIPEQIVRLAQGKAYNIHPAIPDYPGRDSVHFAYYERAKTAGATLHRISPSVDEGEILDVFEVEFDYSYSVMGMDQLCVHASLQLLLINLESIINNTIKPKGNWRWRAEAKTTRSDFLKMCHIDRFASEEEVKRRIQAFFNPAYRTVHVDIAGYRFVFEPKDPTSSFE